MGRRRKWKLDLLSGRTAALLLLSGLFLLGGLAGCVLAGLIGTENSVALREYLDRYLFAFGQGTAEVKFMTLLWQTARFPLFTALLGVTAIGAVGVPVLFAVRGFLMGYAVAVFYRLMGYAGVTLAACLFGLSALIWLPALLELGIAGLLCAFALLRRATGEGRDPLPSLGGYLLRFSICVGAVCLCAGFEYTLLPKILTAVSRLVLP